MLSKNTQLFNEMIDEMTLPDLYKKLLRQYASDILNTEKAASHAKIWHFTLSIITALGGATISALGSQTFNNDVISVIHWFLFSLGLIVTFCGILGGIFSFGKRMQRYETLAHNMKGDWLDFYFLIDSLKSEQDRAKAAQQFLSKLNKMQGELLQVDSLGISVREINNQPVGDVLHQEKNTSNQQGADNVSR